ncbi:MAG: manganese-binding transcriptional regulator MntR [Pirellulaceae bacterium]
MPGKKHQRVRDDHASEVAEDYVEAIADVIADRGVCRSIDLVKQFAVTHATVNNTIARLQRDGLVLTAAYQPIELTDRGVRLANQSRKRHEIVEAFLRKLGVSDAVAAADSEGIEHHVSAETLKAMKRVLEQGWPST